jgi:FAD-dependent urate hydroxylase
MSKAPSTDAIGLDALALRVRDDLTSLCLPAKRWLPPTQHQGQVVHDVVIVGAGMAGLTLCAALSHLGIEAYLIDRSQAGWEGPWINTARMETLRSPKELTGPALGIPSLTFRAWYIAQYGLDRWQALDKIPRVQWAQYLLWYRQVLGLRVNNGQCLTGLQAHDHALVRLRVRATSEPQAEQTLWARRVVLATGRDGLGGPWWPEWAHDLPKDRWTHSGHPWPDEHFMGRRVVVIGAGASAMDAAATVLENGAREARLLIRREQMPLINKSKGSVSPGMAHGFWALPDDWKWRFRHYINQQQVPAPKGSTLRVSRHRQAHFHFGVRVLQARPQGDGVALLTNQGWIETDAVIFATGFRIDWAQRPEFAAIAPHVRLWKDRYTHPAGCDNDELSNSPDLGDLFQFQPRHPGEAPGLERIHCFNHLCTLSQGAVAGDIPHISEGAQRLARGLATCFLAEDASHHFDQLTRYAERELDGDEWNADFMPNDLIDQLVCPDPSEPMWALRRQREKVVRASQASVDVIMACDLSVPTIAQRLRIAAVVAEHSGCADLAAFYRNHPWHTPTAGDRLMLGMEDFARNMAERPGTGDRAKLEQLGALGLSSADIVTLAQLIGLVAYQARVVQGLRAMSRQLQGPTTSSSASQDPGFVHPAHLPKPGEPLRVNGFTSAELGWRAWLPVLDVNQASQAQLAVLKSSHPNAMTSDYYLLLAQQPRILEHRSNAFNAIMYAPAGLSRAERELASTVVSRVNGCVYCASVHALRFEQLAKRNDVIAQVFEQPLGAGTNAREKAIVQVAMALTERPDSFDASHLQVLTQQGLTALETLDLIHSVAIFAWANRLMLYMGEPVDT